MTDRYLRSGDGDNGSAGDSWDNAWATLEKAMETSGVAGDHIFVSSAHAETSTGANVTIASTGTVTSPQWVISVDDTAGPPTTLQGGGKISVTGNYGIAITGSFYCYGMIFEVGSGSTSSSPTIVLANANGAQKQVYESCTFRQLPTGGSATGNMSFGSQSNLNNGVQGEFLNCAFKFGSAYQKLIFGNEAEVKLINCSFESGTSTPAYIFSSNASNLYIDGCDFTNLGTTFDINQGSSRIAGKTVLRNCKFPTSWAGSLFDTAIGGPGYRVEMYDYMIGTTQYRLWIEDYCGKITSTSSIYCDNGASEGSGGFSWKIEPSANVEYPTLALELPEIIAWIDSTGSKTVTVEFAQDDPSANKSALKYTDIWAEYEYLGTSSSQFITRDSSRHVNPLSVGSASNVTTSTATWTGLTTPIEQKLTTTITVNTVGFIRVKIKVASDIDLYVDPKITVA